MNRQGGVCEIFFALNVTFIGYYQSIDTASQSTFYTLLRGVILIVPAFVILPDIIGNIGLWLAIPIAELLTLLVIISVYIARKKVIIGAKS